MESAFAIAQPTQVSLHADGSGFVGQLDLERRDGSRYQRVVQGVSCAEVAEALAFVLALTLTATERPPAEAKEPPPLVEPPASVATREPPRPVEKRRSAWDFGAGVQLGARAGLAPEWVLVQGAFLEARRASPGLFGFSLRAAFLRAPSVHRTVQDGTADFSWWAARLEASPLRLQLFQWLDLVPYAGTHLGRSLASGQPAPAGGVGQSSAQLWADAFGGSRLELAALRWLSIQAQSELLVPFTRYQFAFQNPNTPIYQVPAVAAAAFASVELRFP